MSATRPISLFLLTGLILLGSIALVNELLPDWSWEHYPVHAAVEGLGAFIALVVATLILLLLHYSRLPPKYLWVATALSGMGILDGFHAVTHAGQAFVWLHSMATLVGGAAFSLVWLPERIARRTLTWAPPLMIGAMAAGVGVLSLGSPSTLPVMVTDAGFTVAARFTNIVGGCCFLAAGVFFSLRGSVRSRRETLVLSNHCFLFGISGIIFEFSVLWDGSWWLWHTLRLMAYLIILYYFFHLFRLALEELNRTNLELDERVRQQMKDARTLHESEERFKDMAESASDWFWEMGPDLRFTYHSERYFEITGFRPEEKTGTTRTRYVDPTDREADTEKWAAHLADLETHKPFKNFEYSSTSSTGRVCHVRISGTPILDSDGEFLGYRGTGTDITERMLAEAKEAEKSALLQTSLENMAHGFCVFDAEHKVVAYNKLYLHMALLPKSLDPMGMSHEQILRLRASLGMFGEDNVEEKIQRRLKSVAKGDERDQERTLPDGTVFVYRRKPMPDGGFVVTYTDITERKQAEQKFHGAFDNMVVGVRIRNMDGKVNMINQALCDIMGYPEDELLALKFRDINHPDDVDNSLEQAKRLEAGEIDGYQIEKRYIRKDGRIIWCANSVSVARDEVGKIVFRFVIFQDITERKQAEVALEEKTALLETTFENMAQGFCVYDGNQKLVAFNKEYIEMGGFPPDFIHLGIDRRKVVRFLAEQGNYGKGDIDKLVEARMTSLKAEEGIEFEHQRSNNKHYIFTRKSMPDGGFVATYTDITERKKVEQEVEEKSALLETTFENMAQGFAVYDANQNLASFNQKFIEMSGCPPGFIYLGMNREEILRFRANSGHYGEGDLETAIKKRMDSARKGETHLNEAVRPDGTTYLYQRTPMPNGGFVSTYTDITVRKRAEEEIAEKSTLLETSLENMSQGIVVYDSGLKVRAFNAKYIELLDFPKGLVRVGVPMEEIYRFQAERGDYGPGDVEAHVRERVKSRRSGTTGAELERSLPNGKVISARREPMPDGGYVTTFTDITEKKRAEEERRQLESQLRQSQKLESIGTMAGGIAHDFNNILTPIVGYCGIMLDEVPEDSPLLRKIQGVSNAAKRAMNLTQKILSFSHQGEQARAPIEIQAIVKESLDFLRATGPATIIIDQSIEETCAPVMADATQIQQVIVNLCNNACYAMRESGGRLGVALDMVDVDADLAGTHHNLHIGSYVRLSIRDTGVGMNQKTQERIFEPFFTTKEVGEGTGLGLAITHEIVVSHGGLITVESELGKGTVFQVYLPTTKQSVHRASNSASISEARNERVLFVDDEVENTIVVEEMLGKLGYDVTTATSSIEALELFRAAPEQFDLVITDQTMPHMPGDVFARELIGLRPNLPIILITGFSATVSAETSKALGIREFVMKPLMHDDLDQAIRRALNH